MMGRTALNPLRAITVLTPRSTMRLYAVGDIHGCYRALTTLAESVPIQASDLIITLGDYVDRGPDSKQVVEWVMTRAQRGECIPLRGNHEIMMLGALKGELPMRQWLQFGGQEVIESYARDGGRGVIEDIPIEHLRFLDRGLLPYYETESHIFVHATLAPHLPLARQPDHSLYWERFDNMAPHMSGKTVICGHTAQKSGVPLNVGYAICIDTWVYGDGWITCLDVESGQYWQANQAGQTRSDWLANSQS